jgi:hypothetical protein
MRAVRTGTVLIAIALLFACALPPKQTLDREKAARAIGMNGSYVTEGARKLLLPHVGMNARLLDLASGAAMNRAASGCLAAAFKCP